ncbi:MAG: RNA polymerase sigma factor [Flavobacteriaceae bacterium]|nr:RNA polymerase sigma factor [Flavobacteriaceae bacterium]
MAKTSDKDILKLIKTDENAGFRLLLKEFQQPVYFHIRQMVYNHDDANDITQNVFLKVYRNLSSFKGESKLFTWIYRIATNEALNFIQQKSRKNNVSFEDVSYELSKNLEADIYFDGDEAAIRLEQAVSQLPEKQQLIFRMKYFEELKYDEIAEILDISVGGLKSNYHHAVKKLENFLKDENLEKD